MKNSLSHSRSVAWFVWIIASVFYAYQYILRVMPNIMLEDIMRQFDIGASTFGQFSGVYYIGYSLMHLPIGIMLDRFGPRKVMSTCILLTALGLTPLLFATHWIYPIVGRFFIGIGSSAAILGVFKVIRMTFSKGHFPRMLSFSVMIGLIGAIYGGGPISYMSSLFGYQTLIYIIIAVGILLALMTYWIVPEYEATVEGSILSDVKEVLGNFNVWCCCLAAGLMVGPLEGFADVWGTVFLKQVYGFDGTLAASLPSIIFIGMCFGGPILNFIAEKTGNYLTTIIGSGLLMAVCFLGLIFGTLSSGSVIFNFFLIGICCAYQVLAIYKASTYVREGVAGLTTAIANMIIMIFGYVFHASIGSTINASGGATQSEALIDGISIIPAALLVGSCCFVLLLNRERKGVKREKALEMTMASEEG